MITLTLITVAIRNVSSEASRGGTRLLPTTKSLGTMRLSRATLLVALVGGSIVSGCGGDSDESIAHNVDCHRTDRNRQAVTRAIVGRPLDKAVANASGLPCRWTLRVIRRNGHDLPATMDFRLARVNVAILGRRVERVMSFG